MKLICKREALDENGNKIMKFTKGLIYNFEETRRSDIWKTIDDEGNKEVFFDLDIMFDTKTNILFPSFTEDQFNKAWNETLKEMSSEENMKKLWKTVK